MRRKGKNATEESRDRQSSQSVKRFNKLWKEGDIYHIFIPIVYDDNDMPGVMVGSCWGHKLDGKALGIKKYFAPTTSEMRRGKPVKPDLFFKMSRIARALFNAEQMAEQMAISQDKSLGEQERIKALNDCKDEWDKKTPAVGPLRKEIMTEVIVVPLKEVLVPQEKGKKEKSELRPDFEKMAHVRIDLSEDRIRTLNQLLMDSDCSISEEFGVMEYQQSFPKVNDRADSGRKAVPTLVTMEESFLNPALPWDGVAKLAPFFNRLPEDDEILHNRTLDFEELNAQQTVATFSSFLRKKASLVAAAPEVDKMVLLDQALVYRTLKVSIPDETTQEEFSKRADEEAALLAAEELARKEFEKSQEAGEDAGKEEKSGDKTATEPEEANSKETKEPEKEANQKESGTGEEKAKKAPTLEELHKQEVEDAEELARTGEYGDEDEINPDDMD